MAAVRKCLVESHVATPLASNVAVTSFSTYRRAGRDAVQIVLCDLLLGRARQIQHPRTAARSGSLSMHSNSHSGYAHGDGALRGGGAYLTYACDTHYPWQSAADEIVEGGRVPIEGGSVRIPGRPGLGVTLDYDQLARGRNATRAANTATETTSRRCGSTWTRTWRRIVPRW